MSDEFVFFEKGQSGVRSYGPGWDKYPAVAVGKTGFSLNKPFQEAFSVTNGTAVMIALAKQSRKLGFRVCGPQDDLTQGFVVSGGKNEKERSLHVGSERHTKSLADCCGRAYRAHLNPLARVIEVLLSPENEIKNSH